MTRSIFRRIAPLLLAAGLVTAPAAAQERFRFDRTPGRLPKTVQPLQQHLLFSVDPMQPRFDGETTLTLRVRRSVPAVVLHAHELTLRDAVLVQGGKRRALVMTADADVQTWTLTPADRGAVRAGSAQLVIRYAGQVQGNDAGVFRVDHGAPGARRAMLATQLEAVFARRVFPAFDEPAFRTRFRIDVRAPAGYDVKSNMPATARVARGGQVLHRFAATPPMPSYLVAFTVGHFDELAGSADGVPLRVFSAPGKRAQSVYAMGATQSVLKYFRAYFGVPYALPKLDLVAVPGVRDGAMEDWGLISFEESGLLFDPATHGARRQQRIFNLIAHEVAHQWFGNLVTAASWDEIWLNEAFATWMADKATHRFNPAWELPLHHRRQIDQAMERDGGNATRAIRSGPVREDSVFDVFDDITYTKGGAVLGMLESWIGEAAFQRGLQAYMAERRMSNATAGDLWHHIGRAARRDVAAVSASWTDQPGFPLIRLSSRCEGGLTVLDLAQQPYRNAATERGGLWQVPLTLLHGERIEPVLLTQPRQTLQLAGCPPRPTLANPDGVGFYRVAYAPEALQALARDFATLPAAARITLLSDTFALAQGGGLPLAAALDLLAELPATRGAGREALLTQAVSALGTLHAALAGSDAEPVLKAVVRALLAPELHALGWQPAPGESNARESMRSELIQALARADDEATVARVRTLFDDDEAGRVPLPGAIRSAVIESAGRHADAARFDTLRRRFAAATSESDRWMFARALARGPDGGRARQVLAMALDESVPVNIANRLPGMVAEVPAHAEEAYRFAERNWPALAQRAGDMFGAKAWLLPGAAWHFNRAEQARRLLDDQQRLAGAPGDAVAQRVAAMIERRAALRTREGARLTADLEALAQRLPTHSQQPETRP